MTETTDQVVERLAERVLIKFPQLRLKVFHPFLLEETRSALREALRIGREQAAQTVELIWKHGNVVFSREARDELQYAIRYPEKSDELAAIRNLSTEE